MIVWHQLFGMVLTDFFSGVPTKVAAGVTPCCHHAAQMSTITNRLSEHYRSEGISVPYTMEDFMHDATREVLEEMSPEERLNGLAPEERVRDLSAEERLRGLPAEEIRAYLERRRRAQRSTIIDRLFAQYRLEGIPIPHAEDFTRDVRQGILEEASPEERVRGLSAEERLRGLAPKQRLRGLAPEEVRAYLERLEREQGSSGAKS